ncbi:MAG: 2-succinyl-5-enolpyruvyl-6-hydroxy-3-cyclohexene-1-carboxylic-acid synthase [Flavobacteriales bacterium]
MFMTDHIGAHCLMRTWVALGLRHVVISPGSRNAPLVIAANQFPDLKLFTALDERAAAHMALGMALANGIPAAVISTSGTASLNHGPALAEAYYQGVPLMSVTADRPVHTRNQGLGQSVQQEGMFDAHVLWSGQIDEQSMSTEAMEKLATTAWTKALSGPVHMNMPFEEPLYGTTEAVADSAKPIVTPHQLEQDAMPDSLESLLSQHDVRIVVHIGALAIHSISESMVEQLIDRCAVIADVFGSNQQAAESSSMRLLCGWNEEVIASWRPHAIITVGLPPMDKKLRAVMTSWNAPHWHVGLEANAWDMFSSLQGNWRISPEMGLQELIDSLPGFNGFAQRWEVQRARSFQFQLEASNEDWVDFNVFQWLSTHLVDHCNRLHFANSTAARYAQWFHWEGMILHANRGVAGIDGCLSTAVGDALKNPEEEVVLISGDAAWLYDQNGFQVRPQPKNLKVIVINNGGGNIFRWLEGPEKSGLLERFFESGFGQSMRGSAEQLGMQYSICKDWISLESAFSLWSTEKGPSLLEIATPGPASASHLKSMLDRMEHLLNPS